jgi:hypothetical protein
MKEFGTEGSTKPVRKRSTAWIYYAILAVLGLLAAPSTNGGTLWASLALGAYAVYIFLGGRYVWWVW